MFFNKQSSSYNQTKLFIRPIYELMGEFKSTSVRMKLKFSDRKKGLEILKRKGKWQCFFLHRSKEGEGGAPEAEDRDGPRRCRVGRNHK